MCPQELKKQDPLIEAIDDSVEKRTQELRVQNKKLKKMLEDVREKTHAGRPCTAACLRWVEPSGHPTLRRAVVLCCAARRVCAAGDLCAELSGLRW